MAMGHNLWLHFGVDEHPFATYFDVHQGYRVLTHSQMATFSEGGNWVNAKGLRFGREPGAWMILF